MKLSRTLKKRQACQRYDVDDDAHVGDQRRTQSPVVVLAVTASTTARVPAWHSCAHEFQVTVTAVMKERRSRVGHVLTVMNSQQGRKGQRKKKAHQQEMMGDGDGSYHVDDGDLIAVLEARERQRQS